MTEAEVAALPPEKRRSYLESVVRQLSICFAIVLPKLRFLLDVPLGAVRWRVMWGGRGGGKSWSVARALLTWGVRHRLRILCAREFQVSIKDSVHKLLSDQIEALGLQAHYTVTLTSIIGANGTEFMFKGLRHNIDSVRSMEAIDIVWVEEGHNVSKESWNTLTPTIRKAKSEIWVTFNRHEVTDETDKRFIASPPPDAIIVEVNHTDNPLLEDVLRREERDMFARDPDGHAHVWGGKPWVRSDQQVLNGRWMVEEFEPLTKWDGPYFGADWGFANDPTTLVRLWRADKRLWIDYETGGVGWSNEHASREFSEIPGAKKHLIRGDSARPETIAAMNELGWRIEACEKWPGSVEDGIQHLRSYDRIVIHPRCVKTIEEARLWKYKVNLAGDVLPKLLDGNDHRWDAIRYALGPHVQRSGGFYSSAG